MKVFCKVHKAAFVLNDSNIENHLVFCPYCKKWEQVFIIDEINANHVWRKDDKKKYKINIACREIFTSFFYVKEKIIEKDEKC